MKQVGVLKLVIQNNFAVCFVEGVTGPNRMIMSIRKLLSDPIDVSIDGYALIFKDHEKLSNQI